MKENTHPDYHEMVIRCACGNEITTGSTKKEISVEICSKCHPFYTGKQKLIDSAGRIERFRKKYEKFNDLLVAFVWHLDAREPVQTYALTCKEALEIGVAMGWTRTNSWKKDGAYVTTQPSEKLMHLLNPHLMTGERWWGKVTAGDRQVHDGRR